MAHERGLDKDRSINAKGVILGIALIIVLFVLTIVVLGLRFGSGSGDEGHFERIESIQALA